jgi:predicted permease
MTRTFLQGTHPLTAFGTSFAARVDQRWTRSAQIMRHTDIGAWLETLRQDARYALRSFRQSPLTTAIIVASLALAMGANTAMFSIVNAAMLRALPYTDDGRLMMLWTANTLNSQMTQNTSILNMEEWKSHTRTFADMTAYREADGPLIDPTHATSDAQWIGYGWVTGNFFSLLGRSAAMGRALQQDDFANQRAVAVISHSLWQQRFGAARDVVGKRINVAGVDVDVVGVMPDDFWFPTKAVQLWMPASLNRLWQKSREDRGTRFGAVVGRLARTSTIEEARAELRVVAGQLRREHPQTNEDLDITLVPLQVHVLGTSVPFILALLFGAVSCVLLIACANVAHLLLAHGVARRREIAMRAALGASRRRIARQLLTESLLLSSAGGCLGLIAVTVGMPLMITLAPSDIPRLDEARVDFAVLLFTLALSAITGVLFGLAPAIRMSQANADDLIRATTRSTSGATSPRMRRAFVVGQFALALVLLAGAGLLVRSLLALHAVDSGFGDSGVVTAHLRFHNALSRTQRVALYQEAMGRIRQLPGVRAVGAAATMFWSDDDMRFGLRAIDGHPDQPRDQWEALAWTTIRGDYFQAVAVPLLRGRLFEDTDTREAPLVVVVNETMARRYWPGEDPIGRRIKGFDPRGKNDDWVTVIGVVKDVRSRGLERAPMAQIFEAQSQSLDETENLVVSAATPDFPEVLRRAIRELDRTAVLSDVSTLDQRIREQSAQRRFHTYVLTAFALLALLLAAAGIFGALHYSVVQRTREIGIRIALGAARRTVVGMVFRETVLLAATGVGLGVVVALESTRILSGLLFGVSPQDPRTFAAVSLALTTVALTAACIPAARASRVDPMRALKTD